MARGMLPKASHRPIQIIEPEEFDQLLQACDHSGALVDHVTARDHAILWVFLETGLLASELCRLRLADVDWELGILRVQGKGSKERQIKLSEDGRCSLLSYLDHYRLTQAYEPEEWAYEDHLFLTQTLRSLTANTITQLFARLNRRAGITGKPVNPSLLRETFAVRYLEAGGDPASLQELLGLRYLVSVKRYQRFSDQLAAEQKRQASPAGHLPTTDARGALSFFFGGVF